MTITEKFDRLQALLEEQAVYERSLGKLQFDMECCAPEEGMEQAGIDMAALGRQYYTLRHAPEYEALVRELYRERAVLPPLHAKLAERLYEAWEKEKNISPALSYECDLAASTAYGAWLAAKNAGDFSGFSESLTTLTALTRQTVNLRERQYPSVYDALLNDFERGGSIAQLDAFFGALKARILPLLARIQASGKRIRTDFLSRPCPIPVQESFSRELMELMGLRPTATVLMTTEHPFTTHFGAQDVRITTHYYENNFVSNIFSTLHEGGHALFMQNEPEAFYSLHFLSDGMSNAMHECISRFYENIIGRSEAFIHYLYTRLPALTGDTFHDVSERELYEAVNPAEPGLIRIESDELTYSLHIMIRYELEKAFVNGEISISEIPTRWNAKYKEYLGLDVPNDAQGCLQDVHWAGGVGGFGYFPSYALGNAYGAQIFAAMNRDFDVYAAVAAGDLAPVLRWLKERVFSIASITDPAEWIVRVSGEPLNVDYYLNYLEKKYSALYEL